MRLPREVVESSPSLEVLKKCADVAVGDMAHGHGDVGLVVGLADPRGLSNLNDSTNPVCRTGVFLNIYVVLSVP